MGLSECCVLQSEVLCTVLCHEVEVSAAPHAVYKSDRVSIASIFLVEMQDLILLFLIITFQFCNCSRVQLSSCLVVQLSSGLGVCSLHAWRWWPPSIIDRLS